MKKELRVYNGLVEKLAKINSVVAVGLEPQLVEVEVDVGAGIPSLTIVGLPDKAVEESKERVRLALKNSGFDFPQRKIVVNLAPADVKKEGPVYDLPIAIGILVAGGFLDKEKVKDIIFIGELSLSGQLRCAKGVVQAAMLAKKRRQSLVVPKDNSEEAGLISSIQLFAPETLKDLVIKLIESDKIIFQKTKGFKGSVEEDESETDLALIAGQAQAKRALEIAAAGAHNILLEGPPGAGKTMLAKSIVSILPPLEEEEVLEVTKIYSVAGLLTSDEPIVKKRPFRSPHHTTSPAAMIGGGTWPKPGEVSLSDKGVLFLDEFPEFPRSVLEALRQPLEDKVVTVSRAQGTLRFPADFILVAAKNPCPCGYLGDETHECRCGSSQILAYNRKISGPLLDRIDMHLQVGRIPFRRIQADSKEEHSKEIRQRVIEARIKQKTRSQKTLGKVKLNSLLGKKEIEKEIKLSANSHQLMEAAVDKLGLSVRGYLKTLRLARTIADLEGNPEVKDTHIAEALQYRIRGDSSYGA